MKAKTTIKRYRYLLVSALCVPTLLSCSVTYINNEYQGAITSIGPITAVQCPIYKNEKAKQKLKRYKSLNFIQSKNYEPLNSFISDNANNDNEINRCANKNRRLIESSKILNLVLKSAKYELVYPYGNKVTINGKLYTTDNHSFVQLTLDFEGTNPESPNDTIKVYIRALGDSETNAENKMINHSMRELCEYN